MEDLQEYIVTAKDHECLDCLYDDLETPGGSNTIPERVVECTNRREDSRNTHYLLTYEESQNLLLDERIVDVSPSFLLDLQIVKPLYEQFSSSWSKASVSSASNINWGILRCERGGQLYGWGNDGILSQVGIVTVTSSGRNVDVVIVDGYIDPNNPEYAVNPDGTGGSRVVHYSWFSGYTYPYSNLSLSGSNEHGAHVAGTVAGNTQGWARNANIYNISPYGDGINGNLNYSNIISLIRSFHRNKPINPITGVKNPTIVNNSWGLFYAMIKDTVNISWRGQFKSRPNTTEDFISRGVVGGYDADYIGDASIIQIPAYTSSYNADVASAENEGIIFVGSAGNSQYKIATVNDVDYNNFVNGKDPGSGLTFAVNYHRGSSPSAASKTICVGATNASILEAKRAFSSCGPRVNVYAPGTSIQSTSHIYDGFASQDPRNSNYYFLKLSGTSMASPQVTGLIACIAEHYPRINQDFVIDYINTYWKRNQLLDSGGSYEDSNSLQGSPNIYAFHNKERKLLGVIQPRTSHLIRPSNGSVWPRKTMTTYRT